MSHYRHERVPISTMRVLIITLEKFREKQGTHLLVWSTMMLIPLNQQVLIGIIAVQYAVAVDYTDSVDTWRDKLGGRSSAHDY
jgi:hypothetical protein